MATSIPFSTKRLSVCADSYNLITNLSFSHYKNVFPEISNREENNVIIKIMWPIYLLKLHIVGILNIYFDIKDLINYSETNLGCFFSHRWILWDFASCVIPMEFYLPKKLVRINFKRSLKLRSFCKFCVNFNLVFSRYPWQTNTVTNIEMIQQRFLCPLRHSTLKITINVSKQFIMITLLKFTYIKFIKL